MDEPEQPKILTYLIYTVFAGVFGMILMFIIHGIFGYSRFVSTLLVLFVGIACSALFVWWVVDLYYERKNKE